MSIERLYPIIDRNGYLIAELPLEDTPAISLPSGKIGLDPAQIHTAAQEATLLAHELGHLETATFYDCTTPEVLRSRCEERANRWAYRQLVPPDELRLLWSEHRQREELAEYFGVPLWFLDAALDYYRIIALLPPSCAPSSPTPPEAIAPLSFPNPLEDTPCTAQLPHTPTANTPPLVPVPLAPVPSAFPLRSPEPPLPSTASHPSGPAPSPDTPPTCAAPLTSAAFVRRGYLLLFDQILPNDQIIFAPSPKKPPPLPPATTKPIAKRPRLATPDISP